MRFAYRFGDVALTSSIALPGMRPAPPGEKPAMAIRLCDGPAPAPDSIVYRWRGRYSTRLGTVGDDWRIDSAFDGVFVVNPGLTTVRAYSTRETPDDGLADVLVRRVLPRLITARGALTLHAAAVATDRKAVLLLGGSGAGKSTTTAALAAMPGWHVLSDDLSMLWERDPPVVAPGATGVCLWPESRAGLAIDPAACTAMPGYDGKVRFDPPGAVPIDSVALGALVFLARDPAVVQPRLTPINRAEGLIHAARQMIAFNPAAPPAEERAVLFARLNRIVRDVPMVRLTYPSDFAALPAVAATLAELLAR